jgi:hypothetical protein
VAARGRWLPLTAHRRIQPAAQRAVLQRSIILIVCTFVARSLLVAS